MRATAVRLVALAVIVGIAAAGTLVWLYLPRSTAVNCNAPGSDGSPLGTAFAISSPSEQTVGSQHWYNSTVQSGGGGLRLAGLKFEFQSPSGTVVVPGPAWNLTALNLSGERLGTYALTGGAAGNWTTGGSTLVLSGQTFSLLGRDM